MQIIGCLSRYSQSKGGPQISNHLSAKQGYASGGIEMTWAERVASFLYPLTNCQPDELPMLRPALDCNERFGTLLLTSVMLVGD